ncbi:hypothetical protein GCM10010215_39960 [Streptomyces virginiae]|uniref:Glyoxalase n=1 Tax=Streptomyces virginiae TaxID=1961 RepID=A0ABQ3NZJ9_STRVG|nr:hypothetical protein [Streptomyces virginiae]MBP2343799.1 hypothetical protein [Streptomyces virginiae]GGQ10929.1 hypothetical protein GCM10010215_39960 [Streptomyces virginiae]GHI18191.1 hypothetical protein Scinn_76540 [Streptomyces virginiae]
MKNPEYRQLPDWAEMALRRAARSEAGVRGMTRMVAEDGVLLLQLVHRPARERAVCVQHPFRDLQEAYDKAASDLPPRRHIAYFVVATAAALRRAEAAGVGYMRFYSDGPAGGAICQVPVSLWTESA